MFSFSNKRKLGDNISISSSNLKKKNAVKKAPFLPTAVEKEARSYVLPKGRFIRSEILCKDAKDVADNLRTFGVAILPNVISPNDCDAHFEAVMRDMEKIVPTFKYADPRTWHNLRRHGHALHTMLFQHMGVAWMQSVVNIRQKKEFAEIFAQIWTEFDVKRKLPYRAQDMLMSADGIAVHLNRSDFTHGFHREGHDWLHADKAPSDNVTSVQSFINFCDTRSADVNRNGCLEVFSLFIIIIIIILLFLLHHNNNKNILTL